jgi:hypothetical protein
MTIKIIVNGKQVDTLTTDKPLSRSVLRDYISNSKAVKTALGKTIDGKTPIVFAADSVTIGVPAASVMPRTVVTKNIPVEQQVPVVTSQKPVVTTSV